MTYVPEDPQYKIELKQTLESIDESLKKILFILSASFDQPIPDNEEIEQ